MTRLSSNWTLFLKLFVPIFWVIFFGALCLAVLLSSPDDIPLFGSKSSRFILIGCYLAFFGFLYLTLMRLVRIDFDKEYIYVTNYFKTFRYPFDSIQSIQYENYSIFKLIKIQFLSKSKFGKRIVCLPSKTGLAELVEDGKLSIEF